jgi:dihydrofolate reductase
MIITREQARRSCRHSTTAVFGSSTLWNDLLANDLADELHLMIAPFILGAGTPLFDGKPPVSPRLIDSLTRDGAATVVVRYNFRKKVSAA